MSQITQAAQRARARAGMLRGDLDKFTIDGQHLVEVAANAGTFVCAGTAADQCRPPTTANEVQVTGLGFLMYDSSKQSGSLAAAATTDYQTTDGARIVTHGPGIWVTSTEQLAFGDPVFVQYGSTAADRGKVRNDASSAGSAAAQVYGARVLDTVDATLALIEFMSGAIAGATGSQGITGPTGATGPTGPTGPTGA